MNTTKLIQEARAAVQCEPTGKHAELLNRLAVALGEVKQEPVGHQYQDRDGRWKSFDNEGHYQNTVKDGTWPIRAIYTTPQPAPAVTALVEALETTANRLSRLTLEFPEGYWRSTASEWTGEAYAALTAYKGGEG